MRSKRYDIATEIDPLFPGHQHHKKPAHYAIQHRYKTSVLCCIGAIAIIVGTTVVIFLVSLYLARSMETEADTNLTVSGTIVLAPIINHSLVKLVSLGWPITDKPFAPAPELPPDVEVSIDEILRAIDEGMLMGVRKDEIERNLAAKRITVQSGTPPYFHQKFSTTHSKATAMVKQGYDLDCASRILAKKLNLTKHEVQPVFENLPDVQLLVGCSSIIHGNGKPVPECPSKMKYRKADGRCNNLAFPQWGSSFSPFRRMLSPDYADGISAPRVSVSGDQLPSGRLVSSTVHGSKYQGDAHHSTHLTQWGQFVDHDITSTAGTKGFNGSAITCCNEEVLHHPSLRHPACFPINIPWSDPFYSHFNQTCMEFVRSAAAPRCGHGNHVDHSGRHRGHTDHHTERKDHHSGHSGHHTGHSDHHHTGNLGYRNQFNQLTSFIDGSTIYGSTKEDQNKLRSFEKGFLKFTEAPDRIQLLPLTKDFDLKKRHSGFLDWAETEANVFESGDARVNEQIMLTAMHTIWMREHNRIAHNLAQLNSQWHDEKIFQEARRIVIAQIQHITYNEFLPQTLGDELMDALDMKPNKEGYSYDYDPDIDPTISNVFSTAAYRFGHSQVQGIMKTSTAGDIDASYTRLHKFFFNSFRLINPQKIEELVTGQATMESRAVSRFFTTEVTNHLFETRKSPFGMDLVALNTQRGRDHGLPAYRAWRKHCGLSEPMMFHDLLDLGWPKQMVSAVEKIYSSVDDIDLYTGGLGEPHLPGAVVGPTFACIIADQFLRLKKGDRFWYETSEFPQAFTEAQLTQLHSTSLARIFCDNVDGLKYIQPKVMEMPGKHNMPIKCSSKHIPKINFSYWKHT